jgi:hypothetical protein
VDFCWLCLHGFDLIIRPRNIKNKNRWRSSVKKKNNQFGKKEKSVDPTLDVAINVKMVVSMQKS